MVKMNEDILNVINAVLDYKKFIISNNYVVPKENFDWFMETESYYHCLMEWRRIGVILKRYLDMIRQKFYIN